MELRTAEPGDLEQIAALLTDRGDPEDAGAGSSRAKAAPSGSWNTTARWSAPAGRPART
jgi:hypothetical protein